MSQRVFPLVVATSRAGYQYSKARTQQMRADFCVRDTLNRSHRAEIPARNLSIFMDHHPDLFAHAADTTLLTNAIRWLANKPATPRP